MGSIHANFHQDILKIVVFIEVNVTFFKISLQNTFFGHKGKTSAHLGNIRIFFGISTYLYIENEGQNIKSFIFKKLSKTLYFREKKIHNLFIFRPISNPFESYDSSFHFTCY